MDQRRPDTSTSRPTVAQVEHFARAMRAQAWSQHVIDPARGACLRLWRRLRRAPRGEVPAEPGHLPDASARR